jgi:hypothetical protein
MFCIVIESWKIWCQSIPHHESKLESVGEIKMKKRNSILIETTNKYHDNGVVLALFFLWIFLLGYFSSLLIFSRTSAELILILSMLMLFSPLLLFPIAMYGVRKKYMEITEDGIIWPYISLISLFKDLEGDFIYWNEIRRVVIKKSSNIVKTKSGEEVYFSAAIPIKKDEIVGAIYSIKIYTRKKKILSPLY